MGELSPWHWALVIVVAALLFGSRRLPDAARCIGRSARILKAELRADTTPAAAPSVVPSAVPAPAPVVVTDTPAAPASPVPAADPPV